MPLFVDQLLEYTKFYFDREEKIQLKINYSGYVEHKSEHQNIVENLQQIHNELKQKFETEKPTSVEDNRAHFDEMLSLIRTWVVDHILKTDLDMRGVLSKYPKDFMQIKPF